MKKNASLLILFLLCSKMYACSCEGIPRIHDNWQNADQVFIAECINLDTSGNFYSYFGGKVAIFTLHIEEMFKDDIYYGNDKRTFMSLGGGSCDSYFEPGKKYLVYAYYSFNSGFLKSSACSRTNLMTNVDSGEIKKLRNLYQKFKSAKTKNREAYDHSGYELHLLKASIARLENQQKIYHAIFIVAGVMWILTAIFIWKRK
jgi:hypothetical protein